MHVRTNDLVAFYTDRIEWSREELLKSEERYAKATIQYENKFLSKLFGWKYDTSGGGSHSMWNHWDMPFIQLRIRDCERILTKLAYHTKMCYTLFELDKKHEDAFYKFAQENNLPY